MNNKNYNHSEFLNRYQIFKDNIGYINHNNRYKTYELGINNFTDLSPDEFKRRIITGDVASLKTIPGIGPKMAKRIIVELKERLVENVDDSDLPNDGDFPDHLTDAVAALTSLGFNRADAFRVLKKMQTEGKVSGKIEDVVKMALTEL